MGVGDQIIHQRNGAEGKELLQRPLGDLPGKVRGYGRAGNNRPGHAKGRCGQALLPGKEFFYDAFEIVEIFAQISL